MKLSVKFRFKALHFFQNCLLLLVPCMQKSSFVCQNFVAIVGKIHPHPQQTALWCIFRILGSFSKQYALCTNILFVTVYCIYNDGWIQIAFWKGQGIGPKISTCLDKWAKPGSNTRDPHCTCSYYYRKIDLFSCLSLMLFTYWRRMQFIYCWACVKDMKPITDVDTLWRP